jgi:hypothetical protein
VTSSTGRSETYKSAPKERNVNKDVAPHGSKTLATQDPRNDAAGTSNESPLKIDAIAYVMPCMLTRRSDAMKAAAMANNQGNTVGGRKRTKSAREIAMSDESETSVERATSDESVTSVDRVMNVERATSDESVTSVDRVMNVERATSDESVMSVDRVMNVESVTNVATACPDDKRTNVNAASSRPTTRKEL